MLISWYWGDVLISMYLGSTRKGSHSLWLMNPTEIPFAGLGCVPFWSRAVDQCGSHLGLFPFDSHWSVCTTGQRTAADASDKSRETDRW